MNLIQSLNTKSTRTENDMPTHTSSGNACLDLFMSAGGARGWPEEEILSTFSKAFAEDPTTAMKILFWIRDVRQGAGERRFFRICMRYLTLNHPESLNKVLHLVPEYGRWDDLFELDDKRVLSIIRDGLNAGDGLLAKWLPRKGPFANKIRKYLRLDPKSYRKLIVKLSNTVEQKMCAKEWEQIKYPQVPSQAMNKYRQAFFRNDEDRFSNFLEDVKSGKEKVNAGAIYPYQLFNAFFKDANKDAVEAQWNALPNYMEDCDQRILPVCDTSGSMYGTYGSSVSPISVSVSLGIYISERNESVFKDAFLTFSHRPQIQYLKGTFYDRCVQLSRAHWEMNTNIEAVFDLVLSVALRDNLPEEDMPTTILIISDMQFDRCVKNYDDTVMEMIRDRYEASGYKLPSIVFWNVRAALGQSPVRYDEKNTAAISGFSPSILKSVLNGNISDPMEILRQTVFTERYAPIEV